MEASQKEHLLDLTHGKGEWPPTYVLIYNDLVEQNPAVTIVATWDFRKAGEMKAKPNPDRSSRFLRYLTGAGQQEQIRKILSLSNGILKFTPESDLQKQNGKTLYFSNGLMVNLENMDSYLVIPQKRLQGRPMSLFYMKEGQFIEKSYEGERVDVSALLIEENGSYRLVLADPRLIRSMLFRLYYLKGQGLKTFKPFLAKEDNAGTRIFIYEVDRK